MECACENVHYFAYCSRLLAHLFSFIQSRPDVVEGHLGNMNMHLHGVLGEAVSPVGYRLLIAGGRIRVLWFG